MIRISVSLAPEKQFIGMHVKNSNTRLTKDVQEIKAEMLIGGRITRKPPDEANDEGVQFLDSRTGLGWLASPSHQIPGGPHFPEMPRSIRFRFRWCSEHSKQVRDGSGAKSSNSRLRKCKATQSTNGPTLKPPSSF